MDDATLAAIRAALSVSPDNEALLVVVLRAHLARGEARQGFELLNRRMPRDLQTDEARLVAAAIAIDVGAPERALDWAPSAGADGLMLRARAYAALGRSAEGKRDYAAAVAENPTLEDVTLRTLLDAAPSPAATVAAQRGGPLLRVIANDATDAGDVVRALKPPAEKITFADVGGLDAVKEQIRKRIILPYQKPSLFERFKKRIGGGILLYGPPGCGKTLLARATAGECDAKFFNVSISDILDMYIGESERKLHAIFEEARRATPAVLFFDELEALAGKRQYSREATSSKIVSLFLSELDGFAQNNKGVLVLGATNVPWAIDPAMRRPGRFDRVVFIPPPDRAAREAILRILVGDRPTQGVLDVVKIAERTSGFSGADLSSIVEEAADRAIDRSLADGAETPIEQRDLDDALAAVKPTTLEWLTTARSYARYSNEGGQYDEVAAFLDRHGKR